MKFCLLSDIHATSSIPISRKDNIMETFEKKFSFVLNYAEKEKLIILQAGDLSDSPRNWNILNYLSKQLKQREIKFFAVFGQHDLYMRGDPERSPTSMSILMNAKLIHRLAEAPISIKNVDIYGSDFEGSIPKVINKKVKNILVLHSSIAEKAEWLDHDYTAPAYFMKVIQTLILFWWEIFIDNLYIKQEKDILSIPAHFSEWMQASIVSITNRLSLFGIQKQTTLPKLKFLMSQQKTF
jgi:hypothetical protein